jgi:hypothetical protein
MGLMASRTNAKLVPLSALGQVRIIDILLARRVSRQSYIICALLI